MNEVRREFIRKLKSLAVIASGGTIAFGAISIYQGNERFYRNVFMPAVHWCFETETAHSLAIVAAKWKLVPHSKVLDGPVLKTTLWGMQFSNPVGLAAGFDKNAEAVGGVFRSGFGFVEVGSVTPLPQSGNPKPRMFRLQNDLAVINRCGFNSTGHKAVKENLQSHQRAGVVGVNLGKNKTSESSIEDFVLGVSEFGPIADYLVVNVSSPNTPGLRSLQKASMLENLLDKVIEARNKLENRKPPILVKMAPDLSLEEKQDIARVVCRRKDSIGGLIVCNTTVSRPKSLRSKEKDEPGGLSGMPLNPISTETIKQMFKFTKGEIPIIGVGGIFSGKEAYEKIRAGASLVQIYSALVYEGPPVVTKIKRELEHLLVADGFSNVSEAVGADVEKR